MLNPDLPESPFKSERGLRRLFNALLNSLSGLRLAFRHESAFRQDVALAVVLIPLACLVDVSAAERVLLFGSVLLLLMVPLAAILFNNSRSSFQYSVPITTIGKPWILPVWMSVAASKSSSIVPRPPGITTNA